ARVVVCLTFGLSTDFAASKFTPAMATPIWALPTIKAKRGHTSSPALVTTRQTLLFTVSCIIAPRSTAAIATFLQTLTFPALAVVIFDRRILPGVSETSFTSRALTAVRGHPRGIHFQM